jgi:hypothetical protein
VLSTTRAFLIFLFILILRDRDVGFAIFHLVCQVGIEIHNDLFSRYPHSLVESLTDKPAKCRLSYTGCVSESGLLVDF